MFLVYQILGKPTYRPLNFLVKADIAPHLALVKAIRLSSLAVYNNFKKVLEEIEEKNPIGKIIFIIPHSLYLDAPSQSKEDLFLHDPGFNAFCAEIKEEFKKDFEKVDLDPDRDLDFLPIPSIGTYNLEVSNENLLAHFAGDLETIQHVIFSDIVKRLLRGFLNRGEFPSYVIADISTGFNIYIHSLVEALRGLIVFYKLSNIISMETNDSKSLKTYVAASDPIIGGTSKQICHINLHEIDVKAFFELPLRKEEDRELVQQDYTN